jgi:uncharacterized protein (DUF1501 family)
MHQRHSPSTSRPLTRREVLQLGGAGFLGLSVVDLLAARAAGATAAPGGFPRPVRSVLLVFLPGGPSHLDTFDPKPDAPLEVRGPLGSIETSVAGVRFCEHLPLLAARMKHLAIVRTMSHPLPHHDAACFIPCGIDELPGGFRGAASRGDWPCYAAGLDYLRPRGDGLPNGVCLPLVLKNGPTPLAGANAGFLGAKHDPLQVDHDPNAADFRFAALSLTPDVLHERFDARLGLLQAIESGHRAMDNPIADQYRAYRQRAFDMLTGGRVADAFAIHRESDAARGRYGRNIYGQSLLLARRLIEAGVPVIQANLGNATEWDTHYDNAGPMKKKLLPRLDQALSALVDDLIARGLLESTLVVAAGEFGRTPKIGDFQDGKFWPDGRGHWSNCFSALFAGGGTIGGQVIGESDKIGAYPVSTAYHPSDLGATIYSALGVNPNATIRDTFGRPLRLNEGSLIRPLVTAAS